MDLFYPSYYHSFSCLAGSCPDSCCKEWEVEVDPESAKHYRELPGPLGDRLRQVLRDEDGCTLMTIENGRCPMWRQDGLCRIQAQYGHDALCQTCRDFPRLRHDYGDFAELGLELSCPEAARLIFTADPTLLHTDVQANIQPDYDPQTMKILRDSRNIILNFLCDCPYPLPHALATLLLYAHQVQAVIDGAEDLTFNPQECLADARRYANGGSVAAICALFQTLEILTQRWEDRLQHCTPTPQWDPRLLRMAIYGVQRYWLQAVSDFDLICRVKFIVTGCILVSALGDNPISTAQLFSKEIENDLNNMEALFDAAYSSPALTDAALLGILLRDD